MGEWAGRLISTGAPADEPVPRRPPGQPPVMAVAHPGRGRRAAGPACGRSARPPLTPRAAANESTTVATTINDAIRAPPCGTACTADRTRSIVACAAWLSGGCGQRSLETGVPGPGHRRVTLAMPGVPAKGGSQRFGRGPGVSVLPFPWPGRTR